jgi:cytoskeleton protein RodZ
MTDTTSETSREEETGAYVQIGGELRKARIEAGKSIDEICRQLRLPGMIIEDIEHGRVERLSPLYRRGYIVNYAKTLGLDPASLLAAVKEDEQLPELREVLPVSRQGWKFERYLRVATYVLVTTVIVPPLLYFFIEGGSRIMERDPVAERSEPAISDERPDGERQGRGRIARALALDETDPRREAGEVGHVSASALPLAAVRPLRENGSTEGARAQELLLPAAELLELAVDEADAAAVELSVELLEDSWVEIHAADGERLEYDLLRAGQSRTYRGEAPFQLLLGRANAVRLMLGEELVTFDGHDRSDVARLRLLASGEVER